VSESVTKKYLIYVGLPKCGSTWLYSIGKKCPLIATTIPRDIHFFDFNFKRGYNWYTNFFEKKKKPRLRLEVCHDYIYKREPMYRIFDFAKDCTVLYNFRDPWLLINSFFSEMNVCNYEYFVEHGFRKPRSKSEFLESELTMSLLNYSSHLNILMKISATYKSAKIIIADSEIIKNRQIDYIYFVCSEIGMNMSKPKLKKIIGQYSLRPASLATNKKNNIYRYAYKFTLARLALLARLSRSSGVKSIMSLVSLKEQLENRKSISSDQNHNSSYKPPTEHFSREEINDHFIRINNLTYPQFRDMLHDSTHIKIFI